MEEGDTDDLGGDGARRRIRVAGDGATEKGGVLSSDGGATVIRRQTRCGWGVAVTRGGGVSSAPDFVCQSIHV